MATLSTDWSSLHQQARREESNLASNLESLTKVANSVKGGPRGDVESNPLLGGQEMIERLQDEIQKGLKQLEGVTTEMQQHESSRQPAQRSMLKVRLRRDPLGKHERGKHKGDLPHLLLLPLSRRQLSTPPPLPPPLPPPPPPPTPCAEV